MANEEVEELDLEETETEESESPVKSGNDIILLIIFFIVSSAAVGFGMWFLLNKQFEKQEDIRTEEKAVEAAIDSTAIRDSIETARQDSIEQAILAEKAERERLRAEQEKLVKAAMDSTKQLREERVKKVAKIISSMEPEMAAGVLQSMEDSLAAEIILYMQTRSSGEILSEVNPRKVTNVSKKMIEKK